MKKNNDAFRPESRCRTRLATVSLALVGALSGAHAGPFTLTFGNPDADPTTIFYSLASATQPSYSLSAQIVFDLTSISPDAATFAVTVTNTTASATPGANRLVSFGIDDVTPNLTETTITDDAQGGATWTSLQAETFPGGFGKLELCAIGRSASEKSKAAKSSNKDTDANNCAGGGNGGLSEGHSDSFIWILSGSFISSISFTSPIPIRFQSIDPDLWGADSITFDALPPLSPPVPPTQPPVPPVNPQPPQEPPVPQQVPEPGSLMLVGLGLLGSALARRRRARYS